MKATNPTSSKFSKNFLAPSHDQESMLRKREEFAISLRKQKKQEVLAQKRKKILIKQSSKVKTQFLSLGTS